eukprot:6041883-Pyramimonas_sp.AAC.1
MRQGGGSRGGRKQRLGQGVLYSKRESNTWESGRMRDAGCRMRKTGRRGGRMSIFGPPARRGPQR